MFNSSLQPQVSSLKLLFCPTEIPLTPTHLQTTWSLCTVNTWITFVPSPWCKRWARVYVIVWRIPSKHSASLYPRGITWTNSLFLLPPSCLESVWLFIWEALLFLIIDVYKFPRWGVQEDCRNNCQLVPLKQVIASCLLECKCAPLGFKGLWSEMIPTDKLPVINEGLQVCSPFLWVLYNMYTLNIADKYGLPQTLSTKLVA